MGDVSPAVRPPRRRRWRLRPSAWEPGRSNHESFGADGRAGELAWWAVYAHDLVGCATIVAAAFLVFPWWVVVSTLLLAAVPVVWWHRSDRSPSRTRRARPATKR